MPDDDRKIDDDGLARLLSAAESAARSEFKRIVEATIADLQSQSPIGIFGDVAARHMWDEYCWTIQDGPYDDNFLGFGSLSENWNSTVKSFVSTKLEVLPDHLLVLLSLYASEQRSDGVDDYRIGCICLETIESVIMDEIARKASGRNLDLIGPHRGDAIGYEVSSEGLVGSALSNADLWAEILASHVDTVIDPHADLTAIGKEMVDEYMTLLAEEAEDSTALPEFLSRFDEEIRELLLEYDALPSLEHVRTEVADILDE